MLSFLSVNLQAIDEEAIRDSTLQDIVVTGTRTAVPERAIVSTVSTVDSEQLNQLERISILPTLSEQVPSLFCKNFINKNQDYDLDIIFAIPEDEKIKVGNDVLRNNVI